MSPAVTNLAKALGNHTKQMLPSGHKQSQTVTNGHKLSQTHKGYGGTLHCCANWLEHAAPACVLVLRGATAGIFGPSGKEQGRFRWALASFSRYGRGRVWLLTPVKKGDVIGMQDIVGNVGISRVLAEVVPVNNYSATATTI